ncbi:MAG: nucleotidyltransferase family protein [Deltaproteobacteria bacterium]
MSPCLPLSPSPHLPLTKSPAHPLSLSSYPPFFQPSILPIFQKQMPPKASLEIRKKIYQSLCSVLSDRASQIAWDEFTPADWKLFSQMAEREGVAPLMYWKLKDSPVAVPLSTFNLLRSTYYQTLAQNTLMYQELERILTALDEAGIAVIVLKGAALAATVYEDIGLRPMGDLDLLVREEEFQEALDVLLSIGYMQEPMPHQEFNRQIGYNVHLWRDSNHILKV